MTGARQFRLAAGAMLAMAACLAGAPAGAHHSLVTFDRDEEVRVTGQIVSLRYASPHVNFIVETTDADDAPALWRFETYAPGQLSRRGVEREAFRIGEPAEFTGYRARNGDRFALFERMVLETGEVVEPGAKAPPEHPADRAGGPPGRRNR